MTAKKTPLYDWHTNNGGKVVDFAGWYLPVRFVGIKEEHNQTRQLAGLFDVSHMGEVMVEGENAEKSINYLCCNDISKITPGRAQYSAILNHDGGVVDDIIVYKYSNEKFLICVNASNAEKDFKWLCQNDKYDSKITNLSSQFGQIALQGPNAEKILAKLDGGTSFTELKYFGFKEDSLEGFNVIVARTGYTGEDGFEIFCPAEVTQEIWTKLLELGEAEGLMPVGLGARDTLRLEACYPLHGHELSETESALESGLAWIVKLDKEEFIGKDALKAQKESGISNKLIAFELNGTGIAREETLVYAANTDNLIGKVTSGTKTPTIGKSIGLARIKKEFSKVKNLIEIEVRGKKIKAEVVSSPFYKKP